MDLGACFTTTLYMYIAQYYYIVYILIYNARKICVWYYDGDFLCIISLWIKVYVAEECFSYVLRRFFTGFITNATIKYYMHMHVKYKIVAEWLYIARICKK